MYIIYIAYELRAVLYNAHIIILCTYNKMYECARYTFTHVDFCFCLLQVNYMH